MHRLIYAPNRAQKAANVFARFRQRKEVCEASGTKPCFFVIYSVIVEITYPFDKDNRYGTTLTESRVSIIKGITGINVQVAKKNSLLPNISAVLRLALKKQSVPFAAVSTAVYANAPYEGLSGEAIAGIVVGSVAFVSLGCFALRWFVIKKKSFPDLFAAFKKNNKIKKRRF